MLDASDIYFFGFVTGFVMAGWFLPWLNEKIKEDKRTQDKN